MKRVATPIETSEFCHYGCGQKARFINGSKKLMCCERSNSCPAIRLKNSIGVSNSGRDYKLDYQNLSQEVKDRMAWSRDKFTNTSFEYEGTGNHKKFLIQERGHKCESCGLEEWLNQKIALELEHIDGDNKNNIKENLKLLCPNCHSQTKTWRKRKTKGNNKKYSDDEMIEAIKSSPNLNFCLKKLNLSWGSGQTIVRVMEKYNIKFLGL